MYTYIIVTDKNDGDIFEGTVEQFRNCFFENADMETVVDWAEEHDYEVVYTASNTVIVE